MDIYLRTAKLQDNEKISAKSKEYFRILSRSSIGSDIHETSKPFICIELACILNAHECVRSFFVKLSACSGIAYTKAFNHAVKVLNFKSNLSIKSLCLIFSLDLFTNEFISMQKKIQQSYSSNTTVNNDTLTGAIFLCCCFVGKLPMDRKKIAYLALCSLKELEDLADVILKQFRGDLEETFLNIKDTSSSNLRIKSNQPTSNSTKTDKKPQLYSMVFPWKGFQKTNSYLAYTKWKRTVLKHARG